MRSAPPWREQTRKPTRQRAMPIILGMLPGMILMTIGIVGILHSLGFWLLPISACMCAFGCLFLRCLD